MPSRRRFLAAAAGLPSATALGGCLTELGLAETGYLQVKAVTVAWRHEGRRYRDEILMAAADGESTLQGRVAREYAGIVDSAGDVRVTRSIAHRIERAFLDVTYVVGFCWDGPDGHACRNGRASRAAFNRVQFGDRAEVVFDSSGVDVVDVYEDARGDPSAWENDVRTVDFDRRHEDRGAPGGSTT